ncbi:MAG: HTH domain-containing protein [Acidobacteriia bacterium]|nr:HTH domain-containing protein [Terriglobia bacterium]
MLRLRAQGFTGKEIAAELGVAAKTVYRALKA